MASDGEEGYSIDGIKTTVLQMKEDGIQLPQNRRTKPETFKELNVQGGAWRFPRKTL